MGQVMDAWKNPVNKPLPAFLSKMQKQNEPGLNFALTRFIFHDWICRPDYVHIFSMPVSWDSPMDVFVAEFTGGAAWRNVTCKSDSPKEYL